jgi:hypothetical protein
MRWGRGGEGDGQSREMTPNNVCTFEKMNRKKAIPKLKNKA